MESNLQNRIIKYIKSKGGYVKNNWANMTSEPGVADLTVGYKGLYIAIEVKSKNGKLTPQQGVHARSVIKAGCINCVARSVEDVEMIFNFIDNCWATMNDNLLDCVEHTRTFYKDNYPHLYNSVFMGVLKGWDDGSGY